MKRWVKSDGLSGSRAYKIFIAQYHVKNGFTLYANKNCAIKVNIYHFSNTFITEVYSMTGIIPLSRTCKTSLLFAPLAVCVEAGCSV